VDISEQFDRLTNFMKSDPMVTVMNFVLGVLIILSLLFTYLTLSRTRELRSLTLTATVDNNNLIRANSLLTDVINYNAQAKSPELARIVQSIQQQPRH
jgi:hypothetical protein